MIPKNNFFFEYTDPAWLPFINKQTFDDYQLQINEL